MVKSIRILAFSASLAALVCAPTLAHAQAQTYSPANTDAGAPIVVEGRTDFPVKTEISAGTEGKIASIKLDISQLATVLSGRKATSRVDGSDFTLTVSTPWDGESDAVLFGQDGLSGGTKLKLEYSMFSSKRTLGATPEMTAIEAEASSLCTKKITAANAEAIAALGESPSEEVLKAQGKAHAKALEACQITTTDGASLVASYLPGKLRKYSTQFFARDIIAFTFQGSVGFQKYGFVDPLTLIKGKEKHVGWSAGFRLTDYRRASATALWISADYEEAYKEQDKQIYCPVPAGPNPVQCVQDHAGPPKFEKSAVLKGGVRHRFLDSEGNSHFAIAPSATVDLLDGTWDVSLPMYFIPGKDNSLTGGFIVGYGSEKKDVTFGVFIGAAFGLSE